MADDQFHLGCPGCWAEIAGILDHRHEEKAIKRFKITLELSSMRSHKRWMTHIMLARRARELPVGS
jgi:hypothetical protein